MPVISAQEPKADRVLSLAEASLGSITRPCFIKNQELGGKKDPVSKGQNNVKAVRAARLSSKA